MSWAGQFGRCRCIVWAWSVVLMVIPRSAVRNEILIKPTIGNLSSPVGRKNEDGNVTRSALPAFAAGADRVDGVVG